jgi:flagellar biosynthetic protein FlhB
MEEFDDILSKLHYQWFAAEDEGRTEDATPRRLQKEREEGRVWKSQELIGALVLLLPAAALWILGGYILDTCVSCVRFFFSRSMELDPSKDGIILVSALNFFIRIAAPVAAVGMVAGVAANLFQTGFLFSTKPIVPDFKRVIPNFANYFKKSFLSPDAAFNMAKSMVKLLIIGAVAFFLIESEFEQLLNLRSTSLWNGLSVIASLAMRLLIIVAVLLLALAVPDIFFQRWRYMQDLRMQPYEVKQERKEDEGDPQIRGRIQQRMRNLLRIEQAVPNADVVIVNPTHFAVALEYHFGMEAPMLTAKGTSESEEGGEVGIIKRIARENGVPIIANPPLARNIYAAVNVGELIPVEFHLAVATILNSVRTINERRRQEREAADAAKAA